MFCTDILNLISEFSSNFTMCKLLATCKDYWSKRKEIWFYGDTEYGKNIPKKIKRLFIGDVKVEKGDIPPGVEFLFFRKSPPRKAFYHVFEKGLIPEGVKTLVLPDNIVAFVPGCIVGSLEGMIPQTVTDLTFGNDFISLIKNVVPKSVRKLEFGSLFNQRFDKSDIEGVTHLSFGMHFNQPIEGSIPDSVVSVSFGTFFNHPIKGNLSKVVHLSIGRFFTLSVFDSVPDSVKFITIVRNVGYTSDEFFRNAESNGFVLVKWRNVDKRPGLRLFTKYFFERSQKERKT